MWPGIKSIDRLRTWHLIAAANHNYTKITRVRHFCFRIRCDAMALFASYTYDSGVGFAGEWDETGLRHGFGHMTYPEGARYVGQFDKGLSTGLGVIWFPDGSRYEGEFLQGWFHGHGIFQRRDGTLYEGEFRGGRIWGHGLLTFSDGSHGFPHHEGYFQDCKFIRKNSCKDVVAKAQDIAAMARAMAEKTLPDA